MATLKNLLYTGAGGYVKRPLIEFAVANTTASASNGGSCCLWTVPSGTRYIKFEIWGGGGGGGGACCCQQGRPGGSGSYVTKTLCSGQIVAGCQYTICAGGTTGSAPDCIGCTGNTSYVTGYNLGGTLCARGGCSGDTKCFNWCGQCYQCQMCYFQCCSVGGDINFHGTCGGSRITMYCYNQAQQWAPVAPGTVSGPVFGPSGCTCGGCGSSSNCAPVFPGGGGFSAQAYGGACFCGWYGAAGLVLVTYA